MNAIHVVLAEQVSHFSILSIISLLPDQLATQLLLQAPPPSPISSVVLKHYPIIESVLLC